ncbi:MAG: sigma 54-interacting transcriptional regulator [Bacteroidota bacterium]
MGAVQSTKVDVRIITATNRDLSDMMTRGAFRTDLYYRLSVFPITSPPLRDRKEDIPHLVAHLMRKYSLKRPKRVTTVPIRSMKKLMAYDYPGNIRELENIVERAVVLSKSKYLSPQHWEPQLPFSKKEQHFIAPFEDFQRAYLVRVLQYTKGKVSGKYGAARLTTNEW